MIDPDCLAWDKMEGLIPAIAQDSASGEVRMLGYMNRAAFAATLASGYVTFFSRSNQRLWMKGETSGNRLAIVDIHADCDGDSLLVRVKPEGPTCHLGRLTCFGEAAKPSAAMLFDLEATQAMRASASPGESYTARLLAQGVKRIAQKVGEEGLETALAAVAGDPGELSNEAADLLYHLLLLLRVGGTSLEAVTTELARRHAARVATASS